jgi:hypothetical protein
VNCILCGAPNASDAHFPHAVGMGRNRKKTDLPTVPLCDPCHLGKLHHGDHDTIERLIIAAPLYWNNPEYQEILDTWVAGWRLKQRFTEKEG